MGARFSDRSSLYHPVDVPDLDNERVLPKFEHTLIGQFIDVSGDIWV